MKTQIYPNNCVAIRKSKGEFECITKGKSRYLSLTLQDRPSERIIVCLGQGWDEAWVRNVDNAAEREVTK